MKFKFLVVLAIFAIFLISCGSDDNKDKRQNLFVSQNTTSEEDEGKNKNDNDNENENEDENENEEEDEEDSGDSEPQKDPSLPKPIIHVAFEYTFQNPMSYRNIYDRVAMNLKDTCVSLKNDPNKCDPEWENKYYIRYKWEMTESLTPLFEYSRLTLTECDGSAGQWFTDKGGESNPKRASFTGLMPTPRRFDDANPTYDPEKCSSECGEEPVDNGDKFFFKTLSEYLICHQKYCEKTMTKYYKVNIQAETMSKSGFASDTAEVTVVPKIIPQARVVAQLTYKQGFKTKAESESKEGAMVDLDLHLIKYHSIEAEQYDFTIKEGLLGTSHRQDDDSFCPETLPECEKYWRHDDCSFGDQGLKGADEGRTIQWHASLDIDTTWGGNNYETPETIGLGPIVDRDYDGIPDDPIIEDQYLLVVGYVNCYSRYNDGTDHCDPSYTGDDAAYEVDARIEILVDGKEVPRSGTSDIYAAGTKDFKIKVNEWKAVAVIKWDSDDAIVTDSAMIDEGITTDPKSHPVCNYDNSYAVLVPIWDAEEYRNHIETQEYGYQIGTCR